MLALASVSSRWVGPLLSLRSLPDPRWKGTCGQETSFAASAALRCDAHSLASTFCHAADLDINVETPKALSDARTVFLVSTADEPGGAHEVGIMLEKDPNTGMARVAGLIPGSLAATSIDRSSLERGDLIVAVGYGGALAQVDTVKECNAMLANQQVDGAIELRVVRPGGWPASRSKSSWECRSPSPLQQPPSPPPAYVECGALSTLTSLLEQSRLHGRAGSLDGHAGSLHLEVHEIGSDGI